MSTPVLLIKTASQQLGTRGILLGVCGAAAHTSAGSLASTRKDRLYALANNRAATLYNVTITARDQGNAILSAGFWPMFNSRSYGTVLISRTAPERLRANEVVSTR